MPLSVISLLIHAYIAWRLIPALVDFTWAQIGVALLVILSAISLQVGFNQWRSRRSPQGRGHDIAMVAAFVAMGFLSSLFVLTLLRDVALAALWISQRTRSGVVRRYVRRMECARRSGSGDADDDLGANQCASHCASG